MKSRSAPKSERGEGLRSDPDGRQILREINDLVRTVDHATSEARKREHQEMARLLHELGVYPGESAD